jgi:hypothetical protein
LQLSYPQLVKVASWLPAEGPLLVGFQEIVVGEDLAAFIHAAIARCRRPYEALFVRGSHTGRPAITSPPSSTAPGRVEWAASQHGCQTRKRATTSLTRRKDFSKVSERPEERPRSERLSSICVQTGGKLFVNIMPFEFYCDETGTHDPTGKQRGSEWTGVVGYISTVKKWSQLVKEWQVELQANKAPYFHSSQLRTICPLLNDSGINALTARLGEIASRHTIKAIGVFADVRAYDQIMPQWYKQKMRLPCGMCLQDFFNIAFGEAETHAYLENKHRAVNFFFDEVDPKANRALYEMINETWHDVKAKNNALGLIGHLTLLSKTGNISAAIPLQAADLLAYRIRQVFIHFPPRLKALDAELGKNMETVFYDAEGLRSKAERVERDKYTL